MLSGRSIIAAAFLVVLVSLPASAQRSSFAKARFVSIGGGFSIDLPSSFDDGVLPIGNSSGAAGSYSWKVPEGNFTVGYVEGIHSFTDVFAVLNDFANTVTQSQLKRGLKVNDRIEFNLDGNPGVQLKIERKKGFAVNRFILVRNRLYILSADFAQTENETLILSILDSFQALDRQSLTA